MPVQIEIAFGASIALSALLVVAVLGILVKSRRPAQSIILLFSALAIAWTASVLLAAAADPLSQLLCFAFVLAATVGVYFAGKLVERRAGTTTSGAAGLATRPFWQFTLREMLLTVLVVSLACAFVANSRPFTRTRFFNSLERTDPFGPIWSRMGMSSPGGGRSVEVGPSRATLEFDVETNLPAHAEAEQVARDLKTGLERLLADSGASIHGEGRSGNNFSLSYSSRVTEGDLWAYAVRTSDHRWRFLLLVGESKR